VLLEIEQAESTSEECGDSKTEAIEEGLVVGGEQIDDFLVSSIVVVGGAWTSSLANLDLSSCSSAHIDWP
jgi:hypothetical protein